MVGVPFIQASVRLQLGKTRLRFSVDTPFTAVGDQRYMQGISSKVVTRFAYKTSGFQADWMLRKILCRLADTI